MSVSDTTSGLSLNDILANSSIKTTKDTDSLASAASSATGNKALGKDAFLQLLVTQLKNQNPLEPQGNGEFVAQLAQFSSLEGITTLNDTVSGIAGSFGSSQALQASSLVGRSVIAPGDKAVVAWAQRWCWCICSSLRLSHSVAWSSSLRASASISFFSFS